MNTNKHEFETPSLTDFEARGFAIVSNVISTRITGELVQEITATLKSVHAGESGYALRHLVQLVPAVNALAKSGAIRCLAEKVLGPTASVVRSLFFDKIPAANWKVAWHQDLTIAVEKKIEASGFGPWSIKEGVIHVQPPTSILERMLTIRVHLDDCTHDNGPLQVLPGSHRHGKLSAERISELRKNIQPLTCAVESGGVVLMRPLLLHASSPARIPKHRRVVHLEFAGELLPHGLQWAREEER